MKILAPEKRPLSNLVPWELNPRGIKKDDFERLKKQIKDLGLYKPFIVNQDGIILGGNMRYRAASELGIEEVFVTEVHTDNEKQMLEYALSDNDRAGYYEELQLAELIHRTGIDILNFKVDIYEPIALKDLPSLHDLFAHDFPTEEAFQKFLDESADKELFKFMTTVEVAKELKEIIQTNGVENEDWGQFILRLIKAK
jgi:hypothetical protein